MTKRFAVGDRVRINALFFRVNPGTWPKVRTATVIGRARTPLGVRLVLDGQKTPQVWHQDFLTKIRNFVE